MHHVARGRHDPRLQLRYEAAHLLRSAGALQSFEEIRLRARDVQQWRARSGATRADYLSSIACSV